MQLDIYTFGTVFAKSFEDIGLVYHTSSPFEHLFYSCSSPSSIYFPKLKLINEDNIYKFYIVITSEHKNSLTKDDECVNVFINQLNGNFVVRMFANTEKALTTFTDYIKMKYPDLVCKYESEYRAVYTIPYNTAFEIYTAAKLEGVDYE